MCFMEDGIIPRSAGKYAELVSTGHSETALSVSVIRGKVEVPAALY